MAALRSAASPNRMTNAPPLPAANVSPRTSSSSSTSQPKASSSPNEPHTDALKSPRKHRKLSTPAHKPSSSSSSSSNNSNKPNKARTESSPPLSPKSVSFAETQPNVKATKNKPPAHDTGKDRVASPPLSPSTHKSAVSPRSRHKEKLSRKSSSSRKKAKDVLNIPFLCSFF